MKEVNFVTDTLVMEQLVGENAAQCSMSREIIIPGDVKRIKETENEISDVETEVTEGKVVARGTLIQKIVYLNEEGTPLEHHVEEEFMIFIPYPEEIRAQTVKVYPRVETVKHDDLVKDMEKTILSQTVMMEVLALFLSSVKEEIILDVEEINIKKVQKEKISFEKLVGVEVEVVTVDSEIILDEAAARIDSVNCRFEDLVISADYQRVAIEGSIIKQVFYLEEMSGSLMEENLKDSFSCEVDMQGVEPGMDVVVKPRVSKITHEINPRERNKVNQSLNLNLYVQVKRKEEIEVVTGIEGFQLEKGRLNTFQVIGEASDQLSLLGEIELDKVASKVSCPPESNIVNLTADITEDKIEIKGTVKVKFSFVSEEDGQIERDEFEEDFSHQLAVPGVDKGMSVFIYPRVEKTNTLLLEDKRGIKYSALIDISVKAVDVLERQFAIIDKREVEEEVKEFESSGAVIVVYVVQREDNIFNIAQKFNVSIETIVKENKLEDADLIYEGQKLLITCRSRS
ncbi:DUF3794 and LysM peptidoglycan-binding domain-containing protein [Candidatus Contubernalis alkaliaceticus]|uniref:DUF3794 and LysM peptidoglycan-binding domain-containing protein n=1 Tax=Candidatus Contubernalis alkaliaceticus TaxID=338645 RepID=UPI001F4BD22E|nr:SPOCS domain-containing protein [Candidatus Contubernalis alkalaceticus]UNC90688.1 DUF3794 domain-containing protein [Candidatus Contubernalis alkalaceticus]